MALSPRQFLQYSQVLDLFPLAMRNRILAASEYRNVKPETVLIRRDEEGTFMIGVMSGRLRMSVRSLEGKEMLITMVERGELVGEMSILDEQPRAVDVIAETDSTVMIIKSADFIPVLRSCPDAMMGLLKMTCHRMRFYLHAMELISLQNLPARLARYLMRLSNDYGTEKDGAIVISARLSQMDIAHQLACSRESVNKQLSTFAELGFISMDGADIIMRDLDGLKKFILPMSKTEEECATPLS